MDNFINETKDEWLERISKSYELGTEVIEELAHDCLEETNTNIEVLKKIDKENIVEAERAAHSIKGATASLGRAELSETAQDIEYQLKDKNLSGIEQKVKDLEGHLQNFENFIQS